MAVTTDTRVFPDEITLVTPATDDNVLIGDTSDSGNPKKCTVSDIGKAGMSGNTTTDLPEGTNLYFTDARAVDALERPTKTVTTYTVLSTDQNYVINVDESGGVITITLPDCATNAKLEFILRNSSGTNNVTINRAGGDTINGSTSYTLVNRGDMVHLYSNGSTERYAKSFFKPVSGDVNGPASSNDEYMALFDGVTGKLLKEQAQTVLMPTGAMLPYGGASAPTGRLLCDGTAVSRTTYSALFSAIGETYGVGDTTTTFNVPDLTGNMPVGKDGVTFTDLGDTGGEETHTILEAELPAHTHTLKDTTQATGAPAGNTYDSVTNSASSTASQTTGSVGSGTAMNVLQPYLVVNYIIKF